MSPSGEQIELKPNLMVSKEYLSMIVQEVDKLRKLNSDYKQQIHELRKRCEAITRECEELRQTITDRTDIAARLVAEKYALRAELAAMKATVPYRVEGQEVAKVEQGEWKVIE